MLYCHYQRLSIAEMDLVKLVFKTNSDPSSNSFFKSKNKEDLNTLVTLIKQIPSGKRTYNLANNVWTIPASNLNLIELYADANGIYMCCHIDLDAAMNPQTKKDKNWADSLRDAGKVKSESVEDFFKNAPGSSTTSSDGTLTTEALQQRLTLMIKPFVSFELEDRESFLRGYKIAARSLHPDLGGDAAKMSELNSLFMQYKEVMR